MSSSSFTLDAASHLEIAERMPKPFAARSQEASADRASGDPNRCRRAVTKDRSTRADTSSSGE